MASKIGTIYAVITGDKRPLDKELKAAKTSAMTGAQKIQGALNKISFKAVAVGAAAMGVAVGAAMKKFVDLAVEQEKVEKRLEAVLKSTGEAVGYNIGELKNMASAMQRVTTVGDEMIISGMAILATFKQIRGTAFERTTMAALDLSEVMQQDLRSSVVMLGKALNDPIANLGSLGRAGIQFSEDQKKVIKTLWKTGETASAQGIILDELESQFGGAAKAARGTFGGAVTSLQNTLGDLGEKIGFSLIPHIKGVVDETQKWLDKNEQFIGQKVDLYINEIAKALKLVYKVSLDLDNPIQNAYDALIRFGDQASILFGGSGKMAESWVRETKNAVDKYTHEVERIRRLNSTLPSGLPMLTSLEDYGKESAKQVKSIPMVEPLPLDVEIKRYTDTKDVPKTHLLELDNQLKSNRETVLVLTDMWAVFNDEQTQEASALSMAKAEALGWFADKNTETLTTMSDVAERTAGSMASSFSSIFVDGAMGELDTFESYASGIFKSILSTFVQMMTQMAAAKLIGSLGFAAKGGVYNQSGHLDHYAKGGIVGKPTLFPFAGGTGLMGEAGPEAIMPLTRTSNGNLGVEASGGGGEAKTIINRFEINALDARSFVELAHNNPQAIIGPFTQEIGFGNRSLLSALKGI